MSIRNAAKAILFHENKILLTKCVNSKGDIFYTLPGGRQNQYETMEEAVIRECFEETGYNVLVDRFVALHEEIVTDEAYRVLKPDLTHKIFHVFLCHLANPIRKQPTEVDENQIDFQWFDIEGLKDITLYPQVIQGMIDSIVKEEKILFLDSIKSKDCIAL